MRPTGAAFVAGAFSFFAGKALRKVFYAQDFNA
jgi:hypothetical protein